MLEKLKNKKFITITMYSILIILLFYSITLNVKLCNKIVKEAYQYENDILELNSTILNSISKNEIDTLIEEIDNKSNGKYTGERINGKKEGKGTFVWNDGTIYTGEFDNDKINGQGIITIPGQGTYEGNFINGKRNGEGTYHFLNGDVYKGSWHDDVMSGYGTYTFSNGEEYRGQFLNNQFNGTGTYTKGSNTYTGNWINNQYQK